MAEGKVAKNTAYLLSAFVGQKVLAFVYFTIIARMVGVEGSGRYFVAVSFTTIFSVFVDVGLSNVLVREVAKRPEDAAKLLGNVLGMKTVLAVLTAAAVSAAARLLGYPDETRLMIAVASIVMVLDSIHLVFYATMRGFQNLRYEAFGVVTGQFIVIASGSLFLYLRLPLVFLIVALLCGSTWNVLYSGWSVYRRFGVPLALRLDRPIIDFFRSVTVPFALAGIFSRVYSYIDSVMLSRLVSDKAVGFYAVAYKITFAFQFLPMAFAAAIYPAMSEYHVKDRDKLSNVFLMSLKYLAMAAAPVTAGIFVLAAPIIRLIYGPQFTGSILPLQILILSLFSAFLYWPAGSLLNACDRQGTNTTVMGATMVGNVLLNAFLVPRYAAVGAASAALFGNTMLFIGAFWAASRVVRVDFRAFGRNLAKIILSAVAMALVVWSLSARASVLLLIPLGAVIYMSVLFATRVLTRREATALLAVFLRRGKGVSDLVA